MMWEQGVLSCGVKNVDMLLLQSTITYFSGEYYEDYRMQMNVFSAKQQCFVLL